MQARFRIRTREGEELTPMTLEIFSELVRSGVVRPDDLVFDALTGEWAPAASHPMVQLVNDPLVTHPGSEDYWLRRAPEVPEDAGESGVEAAPPMDSAEGSPPRETEAAQARPMDSAEGSPPPETEAAQGPPATLPAEEQDAEPADQEVLPPLPEDVAPPPVADPEAPAVGETPPAPDDDDLSLDLVVPEEVSPEEEAKAFIAQLQQEREAEAQAGPLSLETEVINVKTGIVEGVVPARPMVGTVEPEDEFGPAVVAKSPPPQRHRRGGWRDFRHTWVIAVILPVAAIVGTLAFTDLSLPLPGFFGGTQDTGGASRAARPVGDSEERLREVALQSYSRAVEALGAEMGVGPVPTDWLEGVYLANPEAYADVRPYWERYGAFVQAVRETESELYLQSYVSALEEAGVTGPVRSARIVTAREAWAIRRPLREAHFARVTELASAALGLHDLMVQLQGRISYEPARGERLSAAPVIEAAGLDPQAQSQLDQALDRVLNALQAAGTDADRSQVPAWLVEGLRETANQIPDPVQDSLSR